MLLGKDMTVVPQVIHPPDKVSFKSVQVLSMLLVQHNFLNFVCLFETG